MNVGLIKQKIIIYFCLKGFGYFFEKKKNVSGECFLGKNFSFLINDVELKFYGFIIFF